MNACVESLHNLVVELTVVFTECRIENGAVLGAIVTIRKHSAGLLAHL